MKTSHTNELQLPVKLTDAELDAARDEIAMAAQKYDEVEEEKKEVTKGYSDHLKGIRSDMTRLARRIKSREKQAFVECLVELDREKKTVRTTRMDTGEVVNERPARQEELQVTIEEAEEHAAAQGDEEEKERVGRFFHNLVEDGEGDDGGGLIVFDDEEEETA